MSIILKGIDMPKCSNEDIMVVIRRDKAEVWQTGYKERTVEAIQIPKPHGRIIDEDEIKAKCINEVFDSMGTVAITDPYPDDEWADDICDVPTILEAEE